jgi:hypothetical protein
MFFGKTWLIQQKGGGGMSTAIAKAGQILIMLGISLDARAQVVVGTEDVSGTGYTQMKDQLREMTYTSHLRNSEYDQWKYLTDLKTAFEGEISSVQGNQVSVQQVKNYCASDTDSYTCKQEDLVISVDKRMSSAIRDWQNAILVIIEIEKTRSGGLPGNSETQELQRINVLMNDIDRFNERAKEEYHLAAVEMVEFQKQNPLLFASPAE